MTGKSDAEYYANRLRSEREAAADARCEAARAAHQALADHYALRLGEYRDQEPALDARPRPFLLAMSRPSAKRA